MFSKRLTEMILDYRAEKQGFLSFALEKNKTKILIVRLGRGGIHHGNSQLYL